VTGVYEKFASIYERAGYNEFSAGVARLLPKIIRQFGVQSKTLLDIACGDGTFSVAMASRGYRVTGIDRSAQMLHLARERARRTGSSIHFARNDMRALKFDNEFDIVTCWYDSLNYLQNIPDLRKTFAGVSRALRPGGLFIFDMNTVRALSYYWVRNPSDLIRDDASLFILHRSTYDPTRRVATLQVTAFEKSGRLWERVDESHQERAYPLPTIRRCLKAANLRERACWGSIRTRSPPHRFTRRVWFVAER